MLEEDLRYVEHGLGMSRPTKRKALRYSCGNYILPMSSVMLDNIRDLYVVPAQWTGRYSK